MKVATGILGALLITIFSAAQAFNVFEENGKVGLKNSQGQVIIPAEYEALGWSQGNFSVEDQVIGYRLKQQWGLISLANKRITPAQFDGLYPGGSHLFVARKKSTLSLRYVEGCINASGKEVIPFQYDGLRLHGQQAVVFTRVGNQYRYGLIDLANHTLIPQQYQDVRPVGSRYLVRNFEGKLALFSGTGKAESTFLLDSISSFRHGYAIVYAGTTQGVLDEQGQLRVAPRYREIEIQDRHTVRAREASTWSVLEGQNKLRRQLQADDITLAGPNLMQVTTAGLVQLTDATFKPITEKQFSSVGAFHRGKAYYTQGRYKGIVCADGKVLVPAMYQDVVMDKNFILVSQRVGARSQWSLLDTLGQKRIQRTYEKIISFDGRLFAVKNRGYWGALNWLGQEVVACTYDSIVDQRDNLLVVKFHGQYGLINLKEEWLVAPQPNPLRLVGHDLFLETKPGTIALRAAQNGSVIYFTANTLEPYADYLLERHADGTVWKLNFQGVIIDRHALPVEPVEQVREEHEGYRAIRRDGRYGFIDSRGRLRIANRYEDVQYFSEGLAAAKLRGHWGFINLQDNIAIQPVYDEVTPFKNGFSHVKLKGLYGLIDKTGRQVLAPRYSAIQVLPSGYILINIDGLYGLTDLAGNLVLHPKYNRIEVPGIDYIIIERDGQCGVVTRQGVNTIPQMYDKLFFDPYQQLFIAGQRAPWTVLKL